MQVSGIWDVVNVNPEFSTINLKEVLAMVNKSVPYNEVQVGQFFTFDNELFIKHEDQENTEGNRFGVAWSIKKGRRYKEWAFGLNDQVIPQAE